MKLRNGFVSNSSSSSYIITYKERLSRDEFYDLYNNYPEDDFFKDFTLLDFCETDDGMLYEVFLPLSDEEREEVLSNPNDWKFEEVVSGLNSYDCEGDSYSKSVPHMITEDMVGSYMTANTRASFIEQGGFKFEDLDDLNDEYKREMNYPKFYIGDDDGES